MLLDYLRACDAAGRVSKNGSPVPCAKGHDERRGKKKKKNYSYLYDRTSERIVFRHDTLGANDV